MSFEYGPSCIPLSAVGMIFNFTGNHLLQYIHAVMRRKIFYPCHTVTSVQLMPNGEDFNDRNEKRGLNINIRG